MTKTAKTSKSTLTAHMPTDTRPVNDGTEADFEFNFDGTTARTLPDWPGYAFTPTGKAASFLRKKTIYLSPGRSDGIYRFVNLYRQGQPKAMLLQRLIGRAFIPNPESKPEVNHIDGDPSNNAVSNLEWVTTKENHEHKKKLGKQSRRMTEELKAEAIALHQSGMAVPDIADKLDTPYRSTAKVVQQHGRTCIVECRLQPANEPFAPPRNPGLGKLCV